MKDKLTTSVHTEQVAPPDAKLPVSCRCFMVFNPIGEDWEQMSIAFKTFEEAKAYYDRQDRKKYPYLRILAELSYNGV